jgi:hypothetical protein
MCVLKNPPTFTWEDCKVYNYTNEKMLKVGVAYVVVSKITFNDLLTLVNTYTTLNDILNQRIPQYCQEYSDTH